MTAPRLWVERLALTNFRNHAATVITAGPSPVVLTGSNGSGKTNILEAVSLLSPGQGLRRAPFVDIARVTNTAPGDASSIDNVSVEDSEGSWIVAARVHTQHGAVDIGTGQTATLKTTERSGRMVRINGEASTSGALADYVEVVWVTPALDGMFTGAASERRRFLDRLILCFDPAHAKLASRFERAMTQRNRLLSDGVRQPAQFESLELQMAETGTAIAAARNEAIAALSGVIGARRERDQQSPFPWSNIALDGGLETELMRQPAIEVEDSYAKQLAANRERDRAAARALDGPHRTDLIVGHGPKSMPAKLCSTGEQKALLLGLVLAHAEMIAERQDGLAPILLLDEITAHLDEARRGALFQEILRIGSQAWMTGTDRNTFAALEAQATFFSVDNGVVTPTA
jgi:DNA replication and repair protein RecF